ncbi:Hypothetical protein NGAL_HAMBI490_60240 [Neorhizobium galegae bv. officinalis]|nr:Hypothetical protein NGAL_HAMBI490_60240 [Neorhizobium galegae bv. officinalis]
MSGIFKSMKRVLTGRVIRRSDLHIMDGTCSISLRMKRDSDGAYVVLACTAAGSRQYYPFERSEFESFVTAGSEIRDALDSDIAQDKV